MDLVLSILDQPFSQRAMLAGAMVGLVCSVTGVFVVLRGLSFISAGISHSAFAGVALGLLFGLNPFFTAIIFCSLIALLIGKVSEIGRIREDTSIGIFLAASMALGVIIMSFVPDAKMDVVGYLFGSILTLSNNDLLFTVGIGVLILIPIFLYIKEFKLVIFDEEQATLVGIPAKKMIYLLLILLAITTVISIRVVGIILSTALIVAPAATALQLVKDFDRAILVSAIIGIVVTELGILLSYYFDSAPGATITMVATAAFFSALLYRRVIKTQ